MHQKEERYLLDNYHENMKSILCKMLYAKCTKMIELSDNI